MISNATLVPSQKEVAQFFRLAVRLHLVELEAVERWADSVVNTEEHARFPFTELVSSSKLISSVVDDLLEQVSGDCEPHQPGRMILALLRRNLNEKTLTPATAIRFALEVGRAGALTGD